MLQSLNLNDTLVAGTGPDFEIINLKQFFASFRFGPFGKANVLMVSCYVLVCSYWIKIKENFVFLVLFQLLQIWACHKKFHSFQWQHVIDPLGISSFLLLKSYGLGVDLWHPVVPIMIWLLKNVLSYTWSIIDVS